MKKNKKQNLKKFFAKSFLCAAITAMVGCVAISLAGCGKTVQQRVCENLSEWTSVYYYGECGSYYASISSGVREEDYKMDGRSGKKVDFALLCVRPVVQDNSANKISGLLTIDGTSQDVVLELNPLNGFYMLDLEIRLSGQEQISFSQAGIGVQMQCESNGFAIDDNDAIRIAAENLEDKILECRHGNNLGAECYLRVLDRRTNQLDSTFWCLTVVTEQNKTYSIVISAKDGSVLAKSSDKDQLEESKN